MGASVTLIVLAALEGVARLIEGAALASDPKLVRADGEFGTFRDHLIDAGGFHDVDRLLESDPELIWKLRPGVHDVPWYPPLWIDSCSNSLGYRDPERSFAAPPNTLRVLCLGDSCAYGIGVRMADSYPQRLEALLAKTWNDRLVEVWNGGVFGWSSDQGRSLLARDGERIHPAIVTVAFGINDAFHWDHAHHDERGHGQCRTDRESRALLSKPSARLDGALAHLSLYRLLGCALRRDEIEVLAADATGSRRQRVPNLEFRDNLRAIAAEARRLGAQPVFLVWPIRWQLEQQAGRDLQPPTPYQIATRETGSELGVPVLDLLQCFAGQVGLYVDSVHLNDEGCRRVADELAHFLFEQHLLPPLSEPASR